MRYIFACLLFAYTLAPTFSQAQITWIKKPYDVGGSLVERADFNGDGFSDLLIYGGSTTSVLLNNGNGLFDASHIFSTSQPLSYVGFLDFNRDGKIDVTACDGSGNFVILQGNGDGTLTLTQSISDGCSWMAVSDFNKDGNPDIAVGVPSPNDDRTNNQIIVYLGDGHGGISSTVVNDDVDFVADDGDPCILNASGLAADFTGDKVADIAFAARCTEFTFEDSVFVVGKGDGTGHFTFHKDIDFGWTAPSHLRMGDVNQDGHRDLFGLIAQHFPFANDGTAIVIFTGKGDGTFSFNTPIGSHVSEGEGDTVTAATVADIDGDGIKDIIVGISNESLAGTSDVVTYFFRVFKGAADGTFKQVQNSSLAKYVSDMTWGDINKDGRADLVLARPGSTDVWLNQTASAPICGASETHTIVHCHYGSPEGVFHFVATPRDNRPINAIQIYIDGTLKFETPEDLLDANLQLTGGTHRLTVKAWDELGPFSETINLIVCTNSGNRVVRICTPADGSTSGNEVHIVASAATPLAFNQLQVYFDGVVRFRTSSRYVDIAPDLGLGKHRITVKGWDSNGAFSSTVNVTVH